eukprot:CAMPEP_0118933160 /NCGR_PEP_ID=MMETSP1169-20130426/11463_1 /TAXON_ID=36882 /ORGANISM="Pyramimonas obovata, Strain CCMP722" /LENGTH=118 /DNA_ID=CAMNT_0006875893 /DNA_START=406 /DNA_END=759 /DNA_ORIENTATION=-
MLLELIQASDKFGLSGPAVLAEEVTLLDARNLHLGGLHGVDVDSHARLLVMLVADVGVGEHLLDAGNRDIAFLRPPVSSMGVGNLEAGHVRGLSANRNKLNGVETETLFRTGLGRVSD